MNEKAFNAAYQHFTSTGYNGSPEDFSKLLKSNEKAFNASFKYFKDTGYNGDKSKFSTLIGVDYDVEPDKVEVDTEIVLDKKTDGGDDTSEAKTKPPTYDYESNVTRSTDGSFMKYKMFEETDSQGDIITPGLYNMDEDTFEREFSEFGVDVERVGWDVALGIFKGNRVKVTIPGIEEPLEINMGGNEEEFAQNMQTLLDYRKNLSNENKGTFTILSTDDIAGNISQEKLDIFNTGDYNIRYRQVPSGDKKGTIVLKGLQDQDSSAESFIRDGFRHAEYEVTNSEGEVVFTGKQNEVKNFLINNPQSKGGYEKIKQAAEKYTLDLYEVSEARFKADNIVQEVKDNAGINYYEEQLTTDIINDFALQSDELNKSLLKKIKTGLNNYFDAHTPDYGAKEGKEERKKEKIKEKIQNFNAEEILENVYRVEAYYLGKQGLTKEDFIAKYTPFLEKTWGIINDSEKGLDKGITTFAKNKIARAKNTYFEQEMSNAGLRDVTRSSIYSSRAELENTRKTLKDRSKFFDTQTEKYERKIKKDIDNVVNEMKGLNVNMSVEYVDIENGEGYYIVKSDDKKLQKKYQNKLNNITTFANKLSKQFKTTQENLKLQWGELMNRYDDPELKKIFELEGAAVKDYNGYNVFKRDVANSVENMLLNVPMLWGDKTAQRTHDNNLRYSQTYLPTMLEAGEAWRTGQTSSFIDRTLGQQSFPLITAIAGTGGLTKAFGAVRGANIAKNFIPAFFGITAGGSKRGEIENLQAAAVKAELELTKLNKLEKELDPNEEGYKEQLEIYREARVALHKTIADGQIGNSTKLGAITTAILAEAVPTRFLATIPNALKITDEISTPLRNVMKAGQRNAWQNGLYAVGRYGKRVGLEVVEEEVILALSKGGDAYWLNEEFNLEGAEETFWSTIITAGTTNAPSITYSSILQHYASRPMYDSYNSITQELDRVNKELKFLNPDKKGYQLHTRQLREERIELIQKLNDLTAETEVMALLNAEKTGDLLIIGKQINELNAKANVDVSLSEEAQEIARLSYINSLSKSEAKQYELEYKSAIKAKDKIINSISLENGIERLYGVEGERIKNQILKKDPSLKKDPKKLLIEVHKAFKERYRNNKAATARRNENILNAVERQVYGMSFEETGRKNRNLIAENELLAFIADQLGITNYNTGLIINKQESINAAQVLQDKNLEDLDLTEAKTDEALQIAILNAYDEQKQKAFDDINAGKNPFIKGKKLTTKEQKDIARADVESFYDGEAEMIIYELRMGDTNAVIIGDKYIVKNRKAAKAELKDGNILAGTALSHEISHAVDQLAFANLKELTDYGKNLHEYMSTNFKRLHDLAMMRMEWMGGEARYNRDALLEDQTSLFWDEYTKSIQDILKNPVNSAELRQILNEGQSTANKFRAMFNGDYEINTGKDAAVYLASYIDNFKKGKLGEFQKRRIDPAKKREQEQAKKEGLKEAKKSANIKSPLLYEQANETGKKVNDLYAARDSNPNWKNDIAQLYDPMLGKYLTSLENKGVNLGVTDDYGNVDKEDKRNNIADFKSNAMYGNRGIIDIIDSFKEGEMVDVVDPKTGETVQEENTISKYINGLLPQRLPEFLKNTTIDFTGFKVDVSKAENIVTTETDQAVNDILTPEVQDQLNTPFLDNVELTQEQVDALRAAITTIVGGKLPDLNAAVSKNRSVTPLIAALKKEFGVKNGPIHRLIQDIMGANKVELEAYLRNPKNKRAMLQTLTTTWLSKNLPKAVEKNIVGKGWTTEHEGAKKGKKPGDVVAWLSSEEGPYKGMTDGKQKIRRNPKANEQVTPAMLLSNFAKGETMTDIRRAGLTKLQLALAQELGMEVFKADMINDGDLKDLFVGRQDLFDRVLNDNFVEEFVRQTERGITKRSQGKMFYSQDAIINSVGGITSSLTDTRDRVEFMNRIPDWAVFFGNNEIYSLDKDAIKASIKEVYQDMPNVIKNIDNIVDAIYFSLKGKPLRKNPIMRATDIIDSIYRSDELADNKLSNYFRTDETFRSIQSDQKRVERSRANTKLYAIERFEELNKQHPNDPNLAAALWYQEMQMIKGHSITGGRIADRRFIPDPNNTMRVIENPEYEKEQARRAKKGEKPLRYSGQVWHNTEDFNNNIINFIKDENGKPVFKEEGTWRVIKKTGKPSKKILYKGENITNKIDFKLKDQTPAAVIKDSGNDAAMEARENQIEQIRENLNNHIKWLVNKWKNGSLDNADLLMAAGNLLSNMNTMVATAAMPGWIADGANVTLEKLIYEHMQPRVGVIISMFDAHINKGGIKDINKHLNNYEVAIIQDSMDKSLKDAKVNEALAPDQTMEDPPWYRYFFEKTFGDKRMRHLVGIGKNKGKTAGEDFVKATKLIKAKIKEHQVLNKATQVSRRSSNPTQGITILDFDDTLATSNSKVISTSPNGVVRKLTAEEFANEGADLLDAGWVHDFSEFNKVVEGKTASLFKKALKLQSKFGSENMFILTARPAESAKSIQTFLKANGLNIPLKNITGLGNSTSEAKALWVADKVGEGYNDFYFADDALQNVQAVDNVLSQFDVKRKIQQAKVKFSKGTLSTKQDLNWKEDNIGYMTTNFDVDGNNYKITLYPTDLNDTNYELEFDLVTEKGLTQEMTGTGNQFKVLGIVYNGLLDVVKQKPNIETIGFSALTKDKSRARVYTILMDKLGKKLGWKTDIYEYGSGTQLDFEVAKPKARKARTKTTESIRNIPAVKNLLNQSDIKSPTQQTKRSANIDVDFNKILEQVTGIEAEKRFSDVKARKRGAGKGRFRFFIPPSHEDFVGLLYNFMGKGEEGNAHRDFFEQNLIRPLNRAYRELNTAKQAIANDYKQLNKQFPKVKKKLTKKTPDGDFTYQDAVRVYLWNKHGHTVPGLSPTDQAKLTGLIMNDSELQAYAETLNVISKQDAYVNPTEHWEAGDIRTDLDGATGRIGRAEFFAEFFENADIIFSQENLNKIEAAYGAGVVSALKDILYRTKTGRNRPSGQNKMVNQFLNYLNGSVASTMFFNIRSAVLQQMSMVNFINYADNNIFAAAKAFANQKQYWADWATIFNSDFMKQRRGGIMTDVNGAELAASVKGATNPIQAVIKKLLQLGFLPTQIGDNIAIATGGATYYRNRINTYLKQGFSKAEAESKAWTDFQVLAESTQQSARPDMISQQQASPLGKVILAFQNVTSQFNRLGKKAFLDIKNRRISPEYKNASNPQLQSDISNLSRIAYYFAIQNLIFYSLQSALFMVMFDDDEEDERWLKKRERMVNGSIDSVLRGTGVWGAVIATLKNMAIKWYEQRDKGWNKDESAVLMEMLNVSPPLGIKARKLVNAEKTLNYNKNVIEEMNTFDIDNPQWSAVTNYVEATTNVPVNRLYNKTQNVRESLDNQHNALERVLMFSGWSKWNLGIGDSEKIKKVKETVKENKKEESKIKSKKKREEKKKIQEEENKKVIEENKKKSKKDGICSAVSASGKRCKRKAIKGGFCTVHEETKKRSDGKEVQCKKRKSNGERCKMKTTNKSGYCYYHD